MRRRTIAEQSSDLPRGATQEMRGAGWLVALGVTGLLPMLLVLWVITANNLQSAWNTFDWTSPPEFFRSVWRWMHHGPPATPVVSLISIFILGYCVLLWQWIVFVLGWRTLLASSWLWAVSSAYFIAVIAVIVHGIYSARDASQEWLSTTLVACLIPSVFLALTLQLWLLKTRPVYEPSKPQ